jgi:hypothetical protein
VNARNNCISPSSMLHPTNDTNHGNFRFCVKINGTPSAIAADATSMIPSAPEDYAFAEVWLSLRNPEFRESVQGLISCARFRSDPTSLIQITGQFYWGSGRKKMDRPGFSRGFHYVGSKQ